MKDLVLLLGFIAMVLPVFRVPAAGVALWGWTALFFPNFHVYGFAIGIPFNKLIAAITIVAFLLQSKKEKVYWDGLSTLVIVFFLWTTLAAFTTIAHEPVVWREWDKFFKITIFFLMARLILREKHQINAVIFGLVLALGFYSLKEGLKFIVSGGGHHISGPKNSIIADNNNLALAFSMALPLTIYTISQFKSQIIRFALIGFLVVHVAAILGTYSRGGFISLAIVSLYLVVRAKRRVLWITLGVVGLVAGAVFVPDKWSDRMNTISSAQEDSSFVGRMIAWKQSTLIAINNPLTGGGFHAVQNYDVWAKVGRDFHLLDFIPTPAYDSIRAKAAHSIYFQVLGDQGFVGLIMFLGIFFMMHLYLQSILKRKKRNQNPDCDWIFELAYLLRGVMLAYLVAGAALSIAYFDLMFVLIAITACLKLRLDHLDSLSATELYQTPQSQGVKKRTFGRAYDKSMA